MNSSQQRNRERHLALIWDALRQHNSLPQVDRWLTNYFRVNKNYGRRDRRFYSDEIFRILRHAVMITSTILSSKWGDIRGREQITQRYLEIYPDPADVWQGLRQISYPEISAIFSEKKAGQKESSFIGPLHPAYLKYFRKRQKISQWSAAESETFLARLKYRPPLWIRLNYPDRKGEVLRELGDNNFSVREEHLGSIIALAIEGDRGIFELETYKKGLFEIQDFASQSIGASVDAHPGMAIWDACAGGGGKTMLLASLTRGRGVVYASDIREYKLTDTKLRARKAGFANVRLLPWAGRDLPEFPKEIKLRQGFHRVLVDAPCSSSGTWRRNPDAMLRYALRDLPGLLAEQASLLNAAAKAVRPGGCLIYATCSWLTEENEEQVQEFLNSNPNFTLEEQRLLGSPQADSDTMFVARLANIHREKTYPLSFLANLVIP